MIQALLFVWACSTGVYAWVVYGRHMKYPAGHLLTFFGLLVCPVATLIFVVLRLRDRQLGSVPAGASPPMVSPFASPSHRTASSREARVVPTSLVPELASIGYAVFGTKPPRYPDVSGYYLSAYEAAGSPLRGSEVWDSFVTKFADELNDGAASAGGWAPAGAFHVARDFVSPEGWSNASLRVLMDRGLIMLLSAGHDGSMIPPFAASRWAELRAGRA